MHHQLTHGLYRTLYWEQRERTERAYWNTKFRSHTHQLQVQINHNAKNTDKFTFSPQSNRAAQPIYTYYYRNFSAKITTTTQNTPNWSIIWNETRLRAKTITKISIFEMRKRIHSSLLTWVSHRNINWGVGLEKGMRVLRALVKVRGREREEGERGVLIIYHFDLGFFISRWHEAHY